MFAIFELDRKRAWGGGGNKDSHGFHETAFRNVPYVSVWKTF